MMTRLLLICLAVAFLNGNAMASTWNRLNRCHDLQYIDAAMRSGKGAIGRNCREASGAFERRILSRSKNSNYPICILANSPVEMTNGFSCVAVFYPDRTNSLSCFRQFPIDDLEMFKEDFAQGINSTVNSYIEEVRKCDVTNGDAAVAPFAGVQGVLWEIGKLEFGVSTGLGKGIPAQGYASHGFLSSDPDIKQGRVVGLEYLYFFRTRQKQEPLTLGIDAAKADKRLIVSLDTGFGGLIDKMRQSIPSGVPMFIQGSNLSLKPGWKHRALVDDYGERSNAMQAAIEAAEDHLEIEGFDRIPDYKIRKVLGASTDDLVEAMRLSKPYGQRALHDSEDEAYISMYMSTDYRCHQEAVVGVVIMSTTSGATIGSFGDIGIAAIGAGGCLGAQKAKANAITLEIVRSIESLAD